MISFPFLPFMAASNQLAVEELQDRMRLLNGLLDNDDDKEEPVEVKRPPVAPELTDIFLEPEKFL